MDIHGLNALLLPGMCLISNMYPDTKLFIEIPIAIHASWHIHLEP